MNNFSRAYILSYEFVVIGRASTDNLGVLLGLRAKFGHRWQKWLKKQNLNGMIYSLFLFTIGLVSMNLSFW